MRNAREFTVRTGMIIGALVGFMPSLGHAEPMGAGTTAAAPAQAGASTSDANKDGPDKSKDQEKSALAKAMDQRHADQEAFLAAHLAALHAGLVLKSDQEALWPPVESAIRDFVKSGDHRRDRKAIRELLQMSPIELLQLRSERLIQRGEAIAALVKATEPLLSSLDEAQKSSLPELLEGMRPTVVLRAAFGIRYGKVTLDDDDSNDGKARPHDDDDHEGRHAQHHRDDDDHPPHAMHGDHEEDSGMSHEGRYHEYGQRQRPDHEDRDQDRDDDRT